MRGMAEEYSSGREGNVVAEGGGGFRWKVVAVVVGGWSASRCSPSRKIGA